MFLMRFDLRAPSTGAPTSELYAAALDMAVWAEQHGCMSVVFSEHHASEDGYNPSPLVLATAAAARTSTLPIMVAVVLLPLYDPVRLAEEMVVLDIVSGGRVMWVAAVGYRPEEYEMFGVDFAARGAIADAHLDVLLRAKTGEPFEIDGRRVHVTPAPLTPGGPLVAWGGGTPVAARRAGRFGIDFFGQASHPRIEAAYLEACATAGHQPGMCFMPADNAPTAVFVADDLDAAWDELGPYLLHDVLAYRSWNDGSTGTAALSNATTIEELRAENGSHRIVTVDQAITLIGEGMPLSLLPLVGGLPPDIAWRYLDTVADRVVPALASPALSEK